ncbi:hypothetical protein ACP70R_033450 [Stipagrostis hirtigluma subsp. patula]
MPRPQRAPSSPCDATWRAHAAAGGGGVAPARNTRSQSPVQPSSPAARSRASSSPPTMSSWTTDDDVAVVPPARGSETPATRARTPGLSRCASPEARARIGAASPATARRVAVRLYESLGRHGLRHEANQAFRDAADDATAAEERSGGGGGGGGEAELTGMACLLKDGFVSYLREFAKITPPIPKQVVKFSGVTYTTKIEASAFSYETFGNKLLECFVQPVRSLSLSKRSAELHILKGIDGYVMPGSMTLVLGPPGSGKSTLLKILAGRVDPGKDSGLTGMVVYNDKTASEVQKSRLIAYVCGQLNKHIPFLSVRETLEFARDCTQGLRPESFTPQMRKFFAYALVEGQDPFIEYVMQILDLKKIENCLVSGISDTDRDNLTTAELALGTYSVMVYDQPLTGSNPAMTYDLVNTIRTVCRIQQSSAVMALNYLSQEAFDLFDRIILLGEGHVLYQGPRQDAIAYFAQQGYMKPPHVESWEFLQDIAADNGIQYLLPRSTPRGLEELVECYYSSDHYLDIIRVIGTSKFSTYWVESEPGIGLSLKKPSKSSSPSDEYQETEVVVAKLLNKTRSASGVESTGIIQVDDVVTGISINEEPMQYLATRPTFDQQQQLDQVFSILRHARGHIRLQLERSDNKSNEDEPRWEQFKRPYVQTWWTSTRTLIQRQLRILKQLHVLSILRVMQACILGIFAGTLFYKFGGQYNLQHMNSVRALGFVATMSILLINMPQLPLYMLQRPIFYKHRDQRFFRTSSYVVAHCITNLLQAFAEALLYSACVYFLAGLTLENNGVVFFNYLVLVFLVAYFGSSIIFFLSAVSSIPEVANAMAGLMVSIFILFSGFVIYPSNIPPYWKWLLHINPIRWANLSFCDQQFYDGYKDPCTKYLNQLTFCKGNPQMASGKAYLIYAELLTSVSGKPWVPYIILIGWTLLTMLMTLMFLNKIEFSQTSQSVPQTNERKLSKNYLYDVASYSSSFDGCMEGSMESGRYKSLDRPKLAPSSMNRMSGEENGSVGSWMEELRVEIDSEHLTIPVTPINLTFLNLSFVRCGKTTKEEAIAFDDVTGYAKPGTMLALVGGAKGSIATLLKCLAGRMPLGGSLTGDLRVNSTKPSTDFSRSVGYAERLDAHQPYLTIRESLQFSARLRLPNGISKTRRHIHVELVLDQLGLQYYANHLVGSLRDGTGKTFEVAKKLTIAVELAANPSILFLEEPLSGLDSSGTSAILSTLSQLPISGQSVIATVSNPKTRSLSFFHQVIILTQEGRQAFFGPVGLNCHEILGYFTVIPRVPQYTQTQNPMSFVMGVIGLGIPRKRLAVTDFAKEFQKSHLCNMAKKAVKSTVKNKKFGKEKDNNVITENYKYPVSPIRQAGLVLLRTQRFLWRNVHYTYSRFTGCVMIGLLMGSLYFKIKYEDTYGVTSRSLYIYMQTILIGVISANNVIPQIGTDRLAYFREMRSKMYLPILYPLSWMITEIPYFLIATIAFVGIGNGMAGVATQTATDFMAYWSVLFLFTLCMTYFGMMATFLAPSPILAAFLVSIITSMWVSASGVVVLFSDIRFYKWMYWTNPFQYAISVLTTISFFCDTSKCRRQCTCPRLLDGSYVWERVASIRSLSQARMYSDVVTLAGMCTAFAVLALLFFTVLKHNSAHAH